MEKFPIGAKVLLYHDVYKSWTVPFRLLNIEVETETSVLQLPIGGRIFRTTLFRTWCASVLVVWSKYSASGLKYTNLNGTDDVSVSRTIPEDSRVRKMVELDTFRPLNLSKLPAMMRENFV